MLKRALLPVLLASALAVACSKKEEAPAPSPTPPAAAPAPSEPATTTPAPAAAAPAPAAEPSAAAAPAATTAAAGGKGESVYKQTCSMCHAAGVAGAPKYGDKADWGPRIAQGTNVLYDHATKGFTGSKGTMPPKGGNTSLSDDDVKAAVDYMASAGK